jgi:hypothetical protein
LDDWTRGRRVGGESRDGVNGDAVKDVSTVVAAPSSSSSSSSHLKSQCEFGNPHLLRTIIDHYRIRPLESHTCNFFEGFEYIDRLLVAEERARIARGDES